MTDIKQAFVEMAGVSDVAYRTYKSLYEAASARANLLEEENIKLRNALVPFATVDDADWVDAVEKDYLVADWFFPSDFRVARAALSTKGEA